MVHTVIYSQPGSGRQARAPPAGMVYDFLVWATMQDLLYPTQKRGPVGGGWLAGCTNVQIYARYIFKLASVQIFYRCIAAIQFWMMAIVQKQLCVHTRRFKYAIKTVLKCINTALRDCPWPQNHPERQAVLTEYSLPGAMGTGIARLHSRLAS